MSWDIFVQGFQNGKSAMFPREIAEEAFGPHISFVTPSPRIKSRAPESIWRLNYGPYSATDLYISDGPDIFGFLVNRPSRTSDFWRGILYVLRHSPTVLFRDDQHAATCIPDIERQIHKDWYKGDPPMCTPLLLSEDDETAIAQIEALVNTPYID